MNITRRGKIARLPQGIRQQLNQRLRDGELGVKLVKWLNDLPETQIVIQEEFDGKPIREQNLSEWRKGGYAEWLEQQQAVESAGPLAAEAGEITQATGRPLSEIMALWTSARYLVATRKVEHASTNSHDSMLRMRSFLRDTVALRRRDYFAERLKLDRDRFLFRNQFDTAGKVLEFCLEEAKQYPEVFENFRTAFRQLREKREVAEAASSPAIQVNPA